ncbi:hypothetical protein ACKWTF_014108 [Chironomus riparius]
MKFVIAVLVAALVCIVTSDPPSMETMIQAIANDANSFTGTADAFKATTKERIAKDPNQYTLEDVQKFMDAVCKLWTAAFLKCAEFKDFVIAEKKAAGKIKA